jgi:hypothetical protein
MRNEEGGGGGEMGQAGITLGLAATATGNSCRGALNAAASPPLAASVSIYPQYGAPMSSRH